MENLKEKFIKHLENCIVPKENWGDIDSDSAQANIGDIWRLIKSGHRFEIFSDYKPEGKLLSLEEFFSDSNQERINIIYLYDVRTFSACDLGGNEQGETIHHYFPTPKRLAEVNGKDWY